MQVWASPTLSDYSELTFLIHHILFCARWPSVGSVEESSINPSLFTHQSQQTPIYASRRSEKQERRRVPSCLRDVDEHWEQVSLSSDTPWHLHRVWRTVSPIVFVHKHFTSDFFSETHAFWAQSEHIIYCHTCSEIRHKSRHWGGTFS